MKKHPMSRDVSGKKNPRYRPVWDRFWEKVDKTGDCWLWTGAKNSSGYGCFGVKGKLVQPHRFIMNATADTCVLHHCDVPLCVNPDHLYFGDMLLLSQIHFLTYFQYLFEQPTPDHFVLF